MNGLTTLTPRQIATIWVNIYNGMGKHGDFLQTFADAYCRADWENKALLEDVSHKLIQKYSLDKPMYLKED